MHNLSTNCQDASKYYLVSGYIIL